MTEPPDVEPQVRRVIVNLCEPCIRGEGQYCHTPGCALFLHRVDLPIGKELLEDAPDPSSLTPAEVREAAAQIAHDHGFTAHVENEGACPACQIPNRIAALIRAMPLDRTAQKITESSEGNE